MCWKLFNILLALSCLSALECSLTKKHKHLQWWQTEVIYQVYPRSFMDSNADGVGDLAGVYQKLPYLHQLGIGCLWLSPILKSPMVDFGYDVSNFRVIDSIFGTMDDFDKLMRRAKKLGMKVIMDYVPNHTSDQHEWFTKSIKKIAPYTDYYIWKDPKYVNGEKQPPNNWLTNFGKTAWTWNDERGQYYFHQFTPQQPELDMRNAVVYEELKNNIIFWLDKGIDGLRIDSVNFFLEDPRFLDEPRSNDPFAQPEDYAYLNHIYSVNQADTIKVVQDWRRIFERYSKNGGKERVMITEAYANVSYVTKFYGTEKEPGAHLPFNFLMIMEVGRDSNAYAIKKTVSSWFENAPEDSWANWVIGNHDNPRPATRYGHFLVDGLHMLQMLLPGTPFVYNGDELGMEDTLIRWDQTVDPRAIIAGPKRYQEVTRDSCRTPLQWDDSQNAGFTKSLHTWLPVNPGYWKVNIKNELNPGNGRITHLQIFKDLIKLRKNIVFQRGDLQMYVLSDWVLAITRSHADHATYAIIINLGSEITISDLRSQRPSLPEFMSIVIPSVNSSYKKGDILETAAILLRPKASVVLTTSEEDWESETNELRRIIKHNME